jgi:uncharacterized repeat protein (TIGR03803 family)
MLIAQPGRRGISIVSLAIGLAAIGLAAAPSDACAGALAKASPPLDPLYAFRGQEDGDDPVGGLVADDDGNIYGTTYYDGACVYCGTVFMLKRPKRPGGDWSFSVIYSFPPDSGNSTGALTIKDGVIYGTAATEVFRLRPLNKTKTKWKHSTLHHFKPLSQQSPDAGVVFGTDGALYGNTSQGGKRNCGTVFRLSGDGDKEWAYELLYEFAPSGRFGCENGGPQGELLIDPNTNVVYGTTFGGGRYDSGTVFQLELKKGAWEYSLLHEFTDGYIFTKADGALPRGRLTFGPDGGIYGTTEDGDNGGFWGQGIVYRLSKRHGGGWDYSILHEFTGGDEDGSHPKSGLTVDEHGNLIGTTAGGGPNPYQGVVYSLSQAKGKWSVDLLNYFRGRKDGAAPWSQPILSKGALYGTAIMGGLITRCNRTGCGTVYRIEH